MHEVDVRMVPHGIELNPQLVGIPKIVRVEKCDEN